MSIRLRSILHSACIGASLLVPLGGCVARGSGRITEVSPIDLNEGANLIPHLAPDGRQGLVIRARGPAGGAPLVMAMLPRSTEPVGWDVIGIDSPDGSETATFDARGRSVVRARAKVGGMPATLWFVAQPDPADPAPAGAPRQVLIQTLRLETDAAAARFAPLASQNTRTRYCSSRDAIAVTFRLALPDDNQNNRCDGPGA